MIKAQIQNSIMLYRTVQDNHVICRPRTIYRYVSYTTMIATNLEG
jgi:hypothetical protein